MQTAYDAQQSGSVYDAAVLAAEEQPVVADRVAEFEDPVKWSSPMGYTFWLAIVNNTFSVCGIAGVVYAHRYVCDVGFSEPLDRSSASLHLDCWHRV